MSKVNKLGEFYMQENPIEVNGSKNKSSRNRNIVLFGIITVIVVIVIVILVVSLSGAESKSKLTITDTHMSVTYNEYLGYSATITGVAKNTSGKNLSYASVEFSVYDASGNNLGTALANINNLGKGDTWRFEATLLSFPSTRPASFKLVEITAF